MEEESASAVWRVLLQQDVEYARKAISESERIIKDRQSWDQAEPLAVDTITLAYERRLALWMEVLEMVNSRLGPVGTDPLGAFPC